MQQPAPSERKSPLKEKPLRLPGQSVDEKIQDKWDDFLMYYCAAGAVLFFAGHEWYRFWHDTPPQPWTYTIIAVAMLAFVAFKFWKLKTEIKLLKQGRDGERTVAEQIEKLRAHGYHVLHDLVAGNFNVDHVLIGSAGIFAVETKTPSKIGKGNRIEFDGEKLLINGRPFVGNPINQARANAKWLHGILKSSTGKTFWIAPIVTFPDWSVVRKTNDQQVLVLNHKEIETAIKNRQAILNKEDVSMAAFHLERFVRTGQKTS